MTVSQADFTRSILDPNLPPPCGLSNPGGTQARKRFDVYRNNVAVSLTEALETAFPVIRRLLGNDNFKAASGVYLRMHPPKSPLMMHYGEEMPSFLENFEPVKHLQYLPDVARLELALRHAYHAADAPPLAPETLQALPAERLMASRMELAPAVRLIRSRWPIHGIWRYNMEDGASKPENRGENVLVARPEFDPQLTTLIPGGGTFVAAIMSGARFGAALETVTEQVPDFDLTKLIGTLIGNAAIIKIKEETE